MARAIKEGQSIYIPFVDGESVLDSQNKPRMYKSVEQFERSYPRFRLEVPELVEYVPVVHGKWIFCGEDRWNDCYLCSKCGKINIDDSKYCPNCGAKMDLEG